MKRAILIFVMMVSGAMLISNDTLAPLGAILIILSSYMIGKDEGKKESRISDHFREASKR